MGWISAPRRLPAKVCPEGSKAIRPLEGLRFLVTDTLQGQFRPRVHRSYDRAWLERGAANTLEDSTLRPRYAGDRATLSFLALELT